MKKILISLLILNMTMPLVAEGSQSKYPLQMLNPSQNAKVYSNSGSLQGYVEPISKNKYQTYNKYHQTEGKYSTKTVSLGSETKVYNHSNGQLQGYTKTMPNGETKIYDKNHQYSGKYKQNGNNVKYYPKN